jgi:hypothetical protein
MCPRCQLLVVVALRRALLGVLVQGRARRTACQVSFAGTYDEPTLKQNSSLYLLEQQHQQQLHQTPVITAATNLLTVSSGGAGGTVAWVLCALGAFSEHALGAHPETKPKHVTLCSSSRASSLAQLVAGSQQQQ